MPWFRDVPFGCQAPGERVERLKDRRRFDLLTCGANSGTVGAVAL